MSRAIPAGVGRGTSGAAFQPRNLFVGSLWRFAAFSPHLSCANAGLLDAGPEKRAGGEVPKQLAHTHKMTPYCVSAYASGHAGGEH